MLYVSDVLYNYDICTIDYEHGTWTKYNMPYKN